jgi:hypothetical protein
MSFSGHSKEKLDLTQSQRNHKTIELPIRDKIHSDYTNMNRSVEPEDETFYLLSRMNQVNQSSVNSAIMVSIFSKNDFMNSRPVSVRDRNEKLKLHSQNSVDKSRYSISDEESDESRILTDNLLIKVA